MAARGVSCRMTVKLRDGRVLVSQVDYPKGSIQNPMNDAEMRSKFESLAVPVIGEARARELADQVQNLEKVASVRQLLELARQA